MDGPFCGDAIDDAVLWRVFSVCYFVCLKWSEVISAIGDPIFSRKSKERDLMLHDPIRIPPWVSHGTLSMRSGLWAELALLEIVVLLQDGSICSRAVGWGDTQKEPRA